MQRSLTKGPITKGILLFALPLMFGNLLQLMYNIADTWVVGRFLGADALAAVGSSYTLMTFLTSILLGLCMGSGAAVSMQYGSGEEARMRQSVFQSFVLIAGMAVALNVLVYLGLGGSSSGNSTGYSDADVELLAKVISAEARGESYEGQVAVGAVILNRVAHPSFPNSISGVVYQNGAFSCVNDSNWYAPVADSAKRAATDALNGWDPSGGAVYYFNASKTSDKFMHSRPVIKVIGNHKFCS